MRSLKTWVEKNCIDHADSATCQNNDEDADYRPILQRVINTRCNYDGAKIEGMLE